MVWIKIKDTEYLNSELITSIHITTGKESLKDATSLVFKYGEFTGEAWPANITVWSASFKPIVDPNSDIAKFSQSLRSSVDSSYIQHISQQGYDPTYNDRMKEKISTTARQIVGKLIVGLNTAKKNGDAIFDLESLLKDYTIEPVSKLPSHLFPA